MELCFLGGGKFGFIGVFEVLMYGSLRGVYLASPNTLSAKLTEGACVKKQFSRILFLNDQKYSYFPRLIRSCRKAPSTTSCVPTFGKAK